MQISFISLPILRKSRKGRPTVVVVGTILKNY